MSSDIYVYYVEKPDDKFFIMKGRREFAIENDNAIPVDVEAYFSGFEQCKEGIKIPIYTKHDYDDPDYITVRIKVEDIPTDVKTIIVEYG